ncbi:glutamate receptor ionotropic, NMDA 2B-like isoform X2 [Lineus longissimus]|uniref:glutamate receptor ionotropic, NMDA 2B-like isoform X2 n=1 Tax=Lineus longissimus TaxID=88925 RepID=UPI00315DEC9C
MKKSFTFLCLNACLFLLCLPMIADSGWPDEDYDEPTQKPMKILMGLEKNQFENRDYIRKLNKGLKSYYNRYYEFKQVNPPIAFRKYSPDEIQGGLCRALNEKVAAMLYISRDDFKGEKIAAGKYFAQVATSLGIPVLMWTPDNPGLGAPDDEDSLVVEISPSMSHQALAMLSIFQRYKWKAFSIIVTNRVGHDQFINTMRTRVEDSTDINEILEVVTLMNTDPSNIKKNLMKIKASDTRIISMFASHDEADKIFVVATELGLTTKEYMWIVTKSVVAVTADKETDEDCSAGDTTDIKEYQGQQTHYPLGILGISFGTSLCVGMKMAELAGEVFTRGVALYTKDFDFDPSAEFGPNITCNMTAIKPWQNGRVLYENMMNATTPGTQTPFFKDGMLRNVKLDIVNLKSGHNWGLVGHWSEDDGLDMQDVTWPGQLTKPPDWMPAKYHLKVLTLEETPYVVYDNPDNVTGKCALRAKLCRVAPQNATIGVANATSNSSLYKCCSGFCIDLLRHLSEEMGFEYQLSEVEDEIWGAPDKDGNWNGLPRALMDGKGDMVMTSLKINPERSEVVDFSVPFLETGITIIVAIRDGAISPTAFLEPYDYPSWCLILVFSVHATGAAIFIFDWLSPDAMDQGRTPIRDHRFSLFRAFWLIWAMLFAASVNTDNPRGVSGRFMASVWALFAVVFLASYTANLAAFMIAKEVYYDLSGIQDIRLKNPYSFKPPFKFATVPNGSTEINLKKNYPDMYSYMKQYNKSKVDEGILATKRGTIDAFIYDASVLQYKASHDEKCKLRTVGKWYAMTGYGVAFPKGSKWINKVNSILTKLQHDGTLERLRKFWLRGACKGNDEKGDKSHPLEIKNFTSAFILLAGGMLLGVLLLLLEHLYFKFVRPRLRKWDKGGYCGLISLSMGKSLTFQESVLETTELIRHHRCKNPICETQLWKAKHELDLALMKIDKLKDALVDHGVEPPAITWSEQDSKSKDKRGKPPEPGFNVGGETSIPPYPLTDPLPLPEPPDSWLRARLPDTDGGRRSADVIVSEPSVDIDIVPDSVYNKKQKMHTSPKKPPSSMPAWKGEQSDDLLIQRSNSLKNTAASSRDSSEDPLGSKKLTKRHKGNLYMGIKDDSFSLEKETVL